MRRNWWRDNSLTIALLTLFAISIVGQALTGWQADNQDRLQHGQAAAGLASYLTSGGFMSAVMENWESEFLQMSVYIVLTSFLFQRGSPESKDPDMDRRAKKAARTRERNAAKRRLRSDGVVVRLYSVSLGLAMVTLFVVSFLGHWAGSTRQAAEEALRHGQPAPTMMTHIADPEFWFQSFQNWQSEFLATATLIVLAIFLRHQDSTQSKKLDDPNSKTGG